MPNQFFTPQSFYSLAGSPIASTPARASMVKSTKARGGAQPAQQFQDESAACSSTYYAGGSSSIRRPAREPRPGRAQSPMVADILKAVTPPRPVPESWRLGVRLAVRSGDRTVLAAHAGVTRGERLRRRVRPVDDLPLGLSSRERDNRRRIGGAGCPREWTQVRPLMGPWRRLPGFRLRHLPGRFRSHSRSGSPSRFPYRKSADIPLWRGTGRRTRRRKGRGRRGARTRRRRALD
jgi:hypothetical protein